MEYTRNWKSRIWNVRVQAMEPSEYGTYKIYTYSIWEKEDIEHTRYGSYKIRNVLGMQHTRYATYKTHSCVGQINLLEPEFYI